jgi:hypothetical protein
MRHPHLTPDVAVCWRQAERTESPARAADVVGGRSNFPLLLEARVSYWEERLKTPTQRFGQTRSGKVICTYLTDDPTMVAESFTDFSSEDDFDAYALFQYLMMREVRRTGVSRENKQFTLWSVFHENRLTDADRAAQMKALSLVISIHIVNHGKGRADHFFRD